jgi:hypothetical protein
MTIIARITTSSAKVVTPGYHLSPHVVWFPGSSPARQVRMNLTFGTTIACCPPAPRFSADFYIALPSSQESGQLGDDDGKLCTYASLGSELFESSTINWLKCRKQSSAILQISAKLAKQIMNLANGTLRIS